jgi:S1-C subfamily serine protease
MDETEGTDKPQPAGWPVPPPPPGGHWPANQPAPGEWPPVAGPVPDWSSRPPSPPAPPGPPGPPAWDRTPGDPYWAPQPPRRGSISVAVTALLVLVAALAGVGIGRSLPSSSSGSSAAGYVPSRGSSGSSGVSGSSGSTGSGTSGPSTTPGTSPQSSRDATGAGGPANAKAIAAKVAPALVDINTDITFNGTEAAGTGIVLNSDGLILTNNHVINGASAISVIDVGNQHTYTAKVVGYDELSDIAVLQLQHASGLKTVSLGTSAKAQVGVPIVAIGNAGGRGGEPSVAPGSITAMNQSIQASDAGNGTTEQLSGLIQTNANVQPGDSGGSLVNSSGQVIGIDTAAAENATTADAAQGFAIPINTALAIGKRIEESKGSSAIHIGATAFLGVEYKEGSKAVSQVVSNSAAQQAGLAQGDIITSLGGQKVSSTSALTKLLVRYHPGDRVTITWVTSTDDAGKATVKLGAGPAA